MTPLRTIGARMVGLLLAISLLSSGPASLALPAGAPVAVAQTDLAGEPCTASPDDRVRREADVPPPLKLTCGTDGVTVGMVRPSALPASTPAAGTERRTAVEAASRRSFAAVEIGRRMNCRAGKWLPLADGSEVQIAPCSLREGNWPQIVLTWADGRTLYQATGLPVLLPVLAKAIAAEAGKAFDLPEAARDQAALAKLFGAAIPPCTAKDYAQYDAALRQARIFNSRSDSTKAEAGYRTALDIQTRVFGPESPGVGEILTSLALEVSNQQRFEEAASLFRRADPIVERTSGDVYRARLLAYRALDAANRNQYREALQLASSATALRRRAIDRSSDFSKDAGGLAAQEISRGELLHSLMIEAQMLLRLDDLASAEAAAGEALEIVTTTGGLPPWWRPNMLAFMGDLNARQGRIAVAEKQHRDALRFRQRIFGESGPTALSHLALGRLYGQEDQRVASLASFHAAFDILERERDTRSAVNFSQIAPFLKIATDPGTPPSPAIDAEIFRAIQLTGASVTDQTIERSAARLAATDPAIGDLIGQTEATRRRLGALRIAYAEETDKPSQLRDGKREAALAADIVSTDSALTDSVKKLQHDYPAYSDLANPGPVSLDAFRAKLAPGEALVDFALGAKESWVVVVSADRLVAKPLAMTDDQVADGVATLRRAFVPRGDSVPRFDTEEAHRLYTALLGPIADQLRSTRHVVFVTHGALASLPLTVLVADGPAKDGTDWLVRHYAVSQVPTLRSFVALRDARANRQAPAQPMLSFSAPDFIGAATTGPANARVAIEGQCRDGGPISPSLLRALAPLPETATETATVAGLLGAKPESSFTGANASEAALRQQALDRYGVLYFATHGLLPGELRCQSEPGLALSPPATLPQSKADDGLLDSSEIAALKLNADLVVLSACNTAEGAGKYGGDALSGLAEAFFYAGARGVIASHWQVPSKPTVTLMTGMFEKVQSSGTAEALRQSQIRMMDQPGTAHPFYWAAFTLIGDGLTASNKVAGR